MGKHIEEFWKNNMEFVRTDNYESAELLNIANGIRKVLEASLDDKQKMLFDEYCECMGKYHDYVEKTVFCNGFAIGTEIVSEIKDIIGKYC